MNLDDVAAELRPRKDVQSIDLGLLLGRRFWSATIKPWLMVVVPLLVVVQTLVAVVVNPWVAVAVGWWMKPLFDRVGLHVVSRGFFGSVPSASQTVRRVVGQWFSRRALADLTWRRPLGDRSVTMPVFVLEGNESREFKSRLRSLYGDNSRLMGWLLAVMGLTFKAMFYLGAAVFAWLVMPREWTADVMVAVDYVTDEANQGVVIAAVVGVTTVATTLVEPLYSSGGFGIYIQRRIEREGWDLEIRFRQIANRLENLVDGSVAVLVGAGLAVVVAASAMAPTAAWADEAVDDRDRPVDAEQIPVDDPQGELDEIIDDSPFNPEPETETRWVPVDEPDDDVLDFDGEWLRQAQRVFAEVAWVVLWVVFGFGVVYALVQMVKYRRSYGDAEADSAGSRWRSELVGDGDDSVVLAGEDDVVDAVRRRWSTGRRRQALSAMLLRSLTALEGRHDIGFEAGWTVARCAREVRDIEPEGPVVAALARAFDELAWAGREPTDEEFDQLVRRFEAVFETGGQADE